MATLHQLTRTTKRPKQRVGRGQSSGRGKTSGRGGKGQTARAGAKLRPAWRDIIKKLPKRRGYGKNRGRTVVGTRVSAFALSLSRVEELFDEGAVVSPRTLAEKGVLGRKTQPVKILGRTGRSASSGLSKKLTFENVHVSSAARATIERAGGSIT